MSSSKLFYLQKPFPGRRRNYPGRPGAIEWKCSGISNSATRSAKFHAYSALLMHPDHVLLRPLCLNMYLLTLIVHLLEIRRTSSPAAEPTRVAAHWARLLISSPSLRIQAEKRVECVLVARRSILLAKSMPLPRTVERQRPGLRPAWRHILAREEGVKI